MTPPQTQIQETIAIHPPVAGASLRGWVVVADWEMVDGRQVLSRLSSPGTASWDVKGYLHEALFGLWAADDVGIWEGNGS